MGEQFEFASISGEEAARLIVKGEIDLMAEEPLVDSVAAALSSSAASMLVLDLNAVRFMDSSGVRAVLRCQRAAKERGVAFRVAVTKGPLTKLFRLAGVTDWFDYE